MTDWKSLKWGDIATIEYGKGIRDYQNKVSGFRVYGTNGPVGFHESSLTQGPGVIIGRKGAYRGVHYSPSDFWVIDTAFYLKPKTKMNMRWAYYALTLADINSLDSGSAIPSTSREDFYGIDVKFPPIEDQNKIANTLSQIDDKIELNNQINETLESMAKAIFKEWFIDFGPVKAKAEGKKPFGMDDETAALFPDSFEESELGMIPKGWEVTTIGAITDVVTKGTTPTTLGKSFTENGINFIKAEAITDAGLFLKDKFAFIDIETDELLRRSRIRTHDVLISIAGTIGRVAIVEDSILPANTNQAIGIIRLKDTSLNFFIYHHLKSIFVQQFISERVVQAVQANLSLGMIQSIPVIAPPNLILEKFIENTASVRAMQISTLNENDSLTQTRDLLLPKLISGELQLNEVTSD